MFDGACPRKDRVLKILFATDGSEASAGAGAFLQALPLPAESKIRVISVVTDPRVPVGPFGEPPLASWDALQQLHDAEQRYADAAVREAAGALARDGIELTTTVRVGGAAHEILAAAEEFEA